jgi:hypothetical protein
MFSLDFHVGETFLVASVYAWSPNKWQIQTVELLQSKILTVSTMIFMAFLTKALYLGNNSAEQENPIFHTFDF